MEAPADREWLGVDVGGSGYRVRRVQVVARRPLELRVDARDRGAEERWPGPAFAPVDLALQRAEHAARGTSPTDLEERCAAARVQALARALRRELGPDSGGSTPIAVAAPGLKTSDGGGIAVLRHGPRDPRFLDRLRAALPVGARVAPRLVGDGLAAARGEQVARAGELRGLERGYYVGGGTGLAEALVLGGAARGLEDLDPPLPRAFELRVPGTARSWEDELAPADLLRRLRAHNGAGTARPAPPAPAAYAERVADLVRARLAALAAHDSGDEPALLRVVLGQAFAFLPAAYRAALVERAPGVELVVSHLRAAPALGAVALALEPGAWS